MSQEYLDVNVRGRAGDAISTLKDLNRELAETGKLDKEQMKTLREVRSEITANNRVISTMKMAYQDQHQTLELTGKAFQSLGSLVGKAQTMYTQYNVAMIRTNQIQQEVKDGQEKYNEAVEKFGAGSAEARKAQEALAESTQKLATAQQQNTAQMIGFVAQIPSMLKGTLDMVNNFKVLRDYLATTNWAGWASNAVTSIGGVTAALTTLALTLGSVVAIVGTAIVSWTQVHVPFQKMVEGANLTTREYMALMRAVSETGLSIDEFGKKLIAGEISVSEYGEVAVVAANKVLEVYKKLQQTPVTPPVTPTQTTQMKEYTNTLDEMEKRLKSLTQAYKDGKIGADDYIPRAKALSDEIKRIKETIALATGAAVKYDDVFGDLGDTITKTARTKSGFESNLVSLNNIMGNSTGVAGNFSSSMMNLAAAIQLASSFSMGGMPTFGGGGISPMLTGGQWGGLGSWAGSALSTAAGINPQGMLSTAATAVAPMLQAMQPKGSLQTWSQQALSTGLTTAQTMVPAMMNLSNIPMVQSMLQSSGLIAPTPPPVQQPATNIFQPVVNAFSNIANSISSSVSSLVSSVPTYYPPPTTPYLPPPELQGGGIATKRTHAIVGDAGPEAIVPLGQLGRNITFNVTFRGLTLRSREHTNEFMREFGNTVVDLARLRR